MLIDRWISERPSVKRHLAKTVTWRIVGTIDTMVLATVITGNPLTGVKIGGFEVITKMLLYFAHERIWYKINFGLKHREKEKSNTVANEYKGKDN